MMEITHFATHKNFLCHSNNDPKHFLPNNYKTDATITGPSTKIPFIHVVVIIHIHTHTQGRVPHRMLYTSFAFSVILSRSFNHKRILVRIQAKPNCNRNPQTTIVVRGNFYTCKRFIRPTIITVAAVPKNHPRKG